MRASRGSPRCATSFRRGCELEGDPLRARGNVAERTALINQRLGDVESTRLGSRIPIVAARLSAMGALFILFFALATGQNGADFGFADIVTILGWGAAGMVGALATGREADRVAAAIRRGVDAWVARVLDAANESQVTE
jgi:hypothetical protein